MIVDPNEKIERAIEDALIIQGWKEAPADYDWDEMDPHDPDAPVRYDFATITRLMEEARVRERQDGLYVVDAEDAVEDGEIGEECFRWAARNGEKLSPETLEAMRRARNKAQGIEDEGDADGR